MSYASTVLADGAIGYWRLNDTSGTTAVDQLANQDGTYSGGFTLAQTGIPGGGAGAGAVRLTRASSGKMAVPDHSPLNVANVFSIEIWVKRASLGEMDIVGDSISNAPFMRFLSGSNVINLVSAAAADLGTSTGTVTADGNFHHLVWTKTGGVNKIYIDGADSSGSLTDHTMGNLGWNVGFDTSSANYLDGTVAEFAVYSAALSGSAVLNHYTLGSAAPSSAVVQPGYRFGFL